MNIILIGPPGVGKGSQATVLSQKLKVPHISTGDIFRENFRLETPIGKLAKIYVQRGELVPDALTNDIVEERLLRKDVKHGLLLDGWPRNLVQVHALEKFSSETGFEIDYVINIDANDDVILKRLTGRRICQTCGAVYHVENHPPKLQGICDLDGGKLIQRDDDKEEIILYRLNLYKESTKPIVDYYEKKGIVISVNGDQLVEEVTADIMKVLGEFK